MNKEFWPKKMHFDCLDVLTVPLAWLLVKQATIYQDILHECVADMYSASTADKTSLPTVT